MFELLEFLVVVELFGVLALPIAILALGRIPIAAWGFSKILGLLLVSWLAWIAASLHLLPFGLLSLLGACVVLALAGFAAFSVIRRDGADSKPPAWDDKATKRVWIWSEFVFLLAFVALTLLISFAPDVWNTEKPMDMGIINAINGSVWFPPHDPWFAGASLNYYYVGHLVVAVMIRLTGVAPTVGYNLGLGLIFGLTATAVFTFTATIVSKRDIADDGSTEAETETETEAAARNAATVASDPRTRSVGPVGIGLLAVGFVLLLGDLAGAKGFVSSSQPLSSFDWWSETRLIPNTINEFPAFSFLLGDLHAHVIVLPFSLLVLTFALQASLTQWQGETERLVITLVLAALSLGVCYAINAWSYPVLAAAVVIAPIAHAVRIRDRRAVTWGTLETIFVLGLSVLVMLPFYLSYDPGVNSVALVTHHEPLVRFLWQEILIYGSFAWIIGAVYISRLRRTSKPWRTLAWLAVAIVFLGTLLAPLHLTGVVILAVLLAIALHALFAPGSSLVERWAWLFISFGIACVLLPEVIYVRDSFSGTPYYRMNTVFKFGYQGWLFLGIAAAIVCGLRLNWTRSLRRIWIVGILVCACTGGAYSIAAATRRSANFSATPRLAGLQWLRRGAPGDVGAIDWLADNSSPSAVVLEAVGDDYSSFGHARISTFSGRATVLGWKGHEIQWHHDPGSRTADVRELYTTMDLAAARVLMARYALSYVVVGPLERTEYGDTGNAKWPVLGVRVYDHAGTTLWKLPTPGGQSPA